MVLHVFFLMALTTVGRVIANDVKQSEDYYSIINGVSLPNWLNQSSLLVDTTTGESMIFSIHSIF